MIYIVSGYRRSGTTAMMGALVVGGIPALVNQASEDQNKQMPTINGYRPTPKGGQYEIGNGFYMSPEKVSAFIKNNDEMAIKVFFDGLFLLPAHQYKVIFMRRNDNEIIESVHCVEQYRKTIGMSDNPKNKIPFDVYRDYNPEQVQYSLDIAHQRRDMDVREVWFHDLVSDPVGVIDSLDLPIDSRLAATAVNKKWYRNRECA